MVGFNCVSRVMAAKGMQLSSKCIKNLRTKTVPKCTECIDPYFVQLIRIFND